MSTGLGGVWHPTKALLGSDEAPRMMLAKMELELTDDTYTVRFGGVAADHGRYRVEPEGLTITGVAGPNAGRIIPCIYRFEDDVLTICYGLDGTRPMTFATGDNPQLYLVHYTRRD